MFFQAPILSQGGRDFQAPILTFPRQGGRDFQAPILTFSSRGKGFPGSHPNFPPSRGKGFPGQGGRDFQAPILTFPHQGGRDFQAPILTFLHQGLTGVGIHPHPSPLPRTGRGPALGGLRSSTSEYLMRASPSPPGMKMGAERRKGNHKGCPYGGLSEPIFVAIVHVGCHRHHQS